MKNNKSKTLFWKNGMEVCPTIRGFRRYPWRK